MSAIEWYAEGTRGQTSEGHRIAILRKPGVRIRLVQVTYPPNSGLIQAITAVEEGGDCAEAAQRLVDTPPTP